MIDDFLKLVWCIFIFHDEYISAECITLTRKMYIKVGIIARLVYFSINIETVGIVSKNSVDNDLHIVVHIAFCILPVENVASSHNTLLMGTALFTIASCQISHR